MSGRKCIQRLLQCAAGMFILLCLGGPAYGEDLLQIYHQAQSNDPTFQAAQYTLEAEEEKYPQARAGILPTVTLNATDNFTDATSAFNGGAPINRGISAWTWTLQLTQPLMRPQNMAASNQSEALVEAAQADFSQAAQDLILRVAQAYFDVLVAQETIATAKAQLSAMQEQEAVAHRGFELGTASITDSDEARSKAELARSQLVAAQNDLEDKRAEIEKLTGVEPGTLDSLMPEVVTPRPEPDNASAWISQARENGPGVRAQRAAMQAADWGITKARAENIWTVDIVASYGTNYSSGSASLPTGYESRIKSSMAGLQFSMPIFSGGLNSSHVREALANRDKTRAQLEEARRKAGADAKKAYAGIVNGMAQTEALQSAVKAGESSVKGNRAGYKLGIRINSDVLNAQQQLFASQRDLAKARYDTLLEGLKLKAAAGVLSESDVVTINKLLEH